MSNPITVTLQFDTVADMLGFFGQAKPPANAVVKTDAPKPADKPKATPAPTEGPSSAPAAASSAQGSPAASDASSTVLDYKVLQAAVFKLAGKSPDAARAINTAFGVKSMKDLADDKRREALAAVEAKIAELEGAK